MKTRKPANLSQHIIHRLTLSPSAALAAGTKYNVPLMNAFALYVGVQAIEANRNKDAMSGIAQSAPMELFSQLAQALDMEGRYLFVNAIANQLRYPNCHTHYFSCVILYLFSEARFGIIQEQITRVLPRAFDRQPTAPVGFTHHVHRTHQESEVQLLGTLVHQVFQGNRATLRVRRSLVLAPTRQGGHPKARTGDNRHFMIHL